MAGSPNPQTLYILGRLGIPLPVYLADIHPKVHDVITRQPVESLGRSRVDPIECLFEHPGQHQQIGAAIGLRLLPLLPVLVGFFVRHVVADARLGLVSPDSDADAAMTDFVGGFVGFSGSFVVFHF